jgi:outer membrane usher protein
MHSKTIAELVLAACFTLAAPARAADQRALLDLWLNQADKGEVAVVLRGSDVLVDPADLDRAGMVDIGGKHERTAGGETVSLASLAPTVSYRVDEATLALRVEVPARMLRTTFVNLGRERPAGIEQRRDTSAFLNYGVRASYPLEIDTLFEGGLSFEGNLLSSTVTVSSTTGVVRGLSSFTVDDHAELRRWVAGESFVSGGPLGAGMFVAGLSVTRTFSIDPYFTQTPSLGTSGSTPTPALLDVYVNGVLTRTAPLPPGPFQVQNVQAPAGSGEVSYVVRDLLGRQTTVSSPYYLGATALAKGISDYTFAAGARRLNIGTDSFTYGGGGLLSRYRRGLEANVTAGARLELAPGLASGGPSVTVVTPMGQLDAEAAASAVPEGLGFAGLFSWAYVSRRFGVGLTVRGASDRYATLNLAAGDDRERLRMSGFTSVAAGRRLSVGAQYLLSLDRDQGLSYRVGSTASIQIRRGLSLMLGVGRGQVVQGSPSFDGSASLTLALDATLSVSTGARFDAGTHEAYVDVNRPLPAGTGFGFRGYAVASATPSALGTGQYQGPYGRYQITVQASASGPTASAEADGAVVWVSGGPVLATRPVQDGFAVVSVPGTPGVRGFLNNQDLGTTGRSGAMVLPNLLPYYANRISIADTDLPLDRTLTAVERTVAPPYRGGALIRFEANPARFYRGRLVVDVSGARVVPAYGEMTVRGPAGEVVSPLGKEGELELSDLPPGRYPARVVHRGGACDFAVEIPRSTRAVADLGELRCVQAR